LWATPEIAVNHTLFATPSTSKLLSKVFPPTEQWILCSACQTELMLAFPPARLFASDFKLSSDRSRASLVKPQSCSIIKFTEIKPIVHQQIAVLGRRILISEPQTFWLLQYPTWHLYTFNTLFYNMNLKKAAQLPLIVIVPCYPHHLHKAQFLSIQRRLRFSFLKWQFTDEQSVWFCL
jgi:hypothetical protein